MDLCPPLRQLLSGIFPFPWIAVNFMVLLIAVSTTLTRHAADPPPPAAPVFATEAEADSAIILKQSNQVGFSSMGAGVSESETESGYQSDDEGGAGRCRSMDSTWREITSPVKGKPCRKMQKKKKKDKRNTEERARDVDEEATELDWSSYTTKGKNSSLPEQEEDDTGDELRQKVEKFIDNFKRDLQRQRQESDQRFLEMISRQL